MDIDSLSYTMKRMKKLEDIRSRGFSGRLHFKKRISPNKIFKLFKEFVSLDDTKKTMLSKYTRSEQLLLNSLQYSFEFNKKWHHKILCDSNIQNDYFPTLTYLNSPPLENLSSEEINNVRAIIIIMQNQNCFKNFNPLLASKIIAYNFQSIDKNSNNSLANNRRVFKEHCIKSDKNNSKFTPLISEVKLHLINQYL